LFAKTNVEIQNIWSPKVKKKKRKKIYKGK